MALDASQVRVALTGHVFFGADVTTDPTGFSTNGALTGFKELGYTTEDGVTFTIGKETEDIMGWQSSDPLRVVVTAEPKSAAFTLRQLNKDNWATTFGGTFTTEGIAPDQTVLWEPGLAEIVEGFLVIEFEDGDDKYQIGFRRAQAAAEIEFSFVRSDSVNLPQEMRALAPADGGRPWFMRTDDLAAFPTA